MVTVGAFIACMYQVITIFMQYYLYEVSVSKTFTYQRQATFPAVTFCNMNPVKRSAVSDNSQFSKLTSQQAKKRRRRHQQPSGDKDVIYHNQNQNSLKDDVEILSRHKRCELKPTVFS